MSTRVDPRRQLAALVALVALAGLTLVVVVFLARDIEFVMLGLVGLAIASGGAWWAITEVPPQRTVGVVAAVMGVVVIGAALVGAFSDAERVVVRLAAVVAVFAIGTASARFALRRPPHVAVVRASGGPPRHPVLLCNLWSGGGKVERFGLIGLAEEMGVETVLLDHGLDLEQLARDAVARGADCLGMAGGDGSQALVASIAVEHGLPFVCISAGTRNHFALDLGLNRDDPRETMPAFRDALERHVDFATVNDRFFVNNVSLGIYAAVVQQEGYRDAKVDTTKALLPELLGRQSEPFDLQFTLPDGTEVDGAFLVLVSNNPYVIGASLEASQRRMIDSGRLGVVAVSSSTGSEAARLMTLSAVGQRSRSPFWHEFTAPEFEVRSRSGRAFAGIDGEALELDTPLRFRIHPGGLRLLVPEGNHEAVERRRAGNVDLRSLLLVAGGRDPGDAT